LSASVDTRGLQSLLQKLGEGFILREVLHFQPNQDALGRGRGLVISRAEYNRDPVLSRISHNRIT
jgi:hypothetical protein